MKIRAFEVIDKLASIHIDVEDPTEGLGVVNLIIGQLLAAGVTLPRPVSAPLGASPVVLAPPEVVKTELGDAVVEQRADGKFVAKIGEYAGSGDDKDEAIVTLLSAIDQAKQAAPAVSKPVRQLKTPPRNEAVAAAAAAGVPITAKADAHTSSQAAIPAAQALASASQAATPAAQPAAAASAQQPAASIVAVPPQVAAAQTFKQVMEWMLANGFKDVEAISAKCDEFRAGSPVIARLTGDVKDRIGRALLVMNPGA